MFKTFKRSWLSWPNPHLQIGDCPLSFHVWDVVFIYILYYIAFLPSFTSLFLSVDSILPHINKFFFSETKVIPKVEEMISEKKRRDIPRFLPFYIPISVCRFCPYKWAIFQIWRRWYPSSVKLIPSLSSLRMAGPAVFLLVGFTLRWHRHGGDGHDVWWVPMASSEALVLDKGVWRGKIIRR